MPRPDLDHAASVGRWVYVVGAVAVLCSVLAFASAWPSLRAVGASIAVAAWVVPGLVALHLGQLLLAGFGWRALVFGPKPGLGAFYRLRIIREGIDSLLPVAQIGGEVVGAQLLSRRGIAVSRAGASVIVDVTLELGSQILFLVLGLVALGWLSSDGSWRLWISALLGGGAALAGLVLAQRFGLLRALEALLRGIARRWPALAGASLDGLHAAALDIYRRPTALLRSLSIHLLAWMLGSIETWVVLRSLGVSISPVEAFVVESLGMAARSAGFAIPAALGAQEGGFVLAGAAIGIPLAPALALSLIKRIREIIVGLIGLALWRVATRPQPAT